MADLDFFGHEFIELTLLLQQACGVLNIDIISVNLSERLPFNFKHAQIKQVKLLCSRLVLVTNYLKLISLS